MKIRISALQRKSENLILLPLLPVVWLRKKNVPGESELA